MTTSRLAVPRPPQEGTLDLWDGSRLISLDWTGVDAPGSAAGVPPEDQLSQADSFVETELDVAVPEELLARFAVGIDGGWDGKWLFYLRDGELRVRRTWTGQLMYRLRLEAAGGQRRITALLISSEVVDPPFSEPEWALGVVMEWFQADLVPA